MPVEEQVSTGPDGPAEMPERTVGKDGKSRPATMPKPARGTTPAHDGVRGAKLLKFGSFPAAPCVRLKSATVADLNIQAKALYALASNTVPDEVRAEFVAKVKT